MSAREALIEDILAWAPPAKEKVRSARQQLAKKTEGELVARHTRLKLLEEWASAELLDIAPSAVAQRRRQIAEDDRFAADLMAALENDTDLGAVVRNHQRSLAAPAIISSASKKPAAATSSLKLEKQSNLLGHFSELCRPIIRSAFPRAFDLGPTIQNVSLSLQEEGGAIDLRAILLSWKWERVEFSCEFDLDRRSVHFDVPDIALIKDNLAVLFDIKRREIEEHLKPLFERVDWSSLVRGHLFGASLSANRDALDQSLSRVVARHLDYGSTALLGMDFAGYSVAEFAGRYEPSAHVPTLLVPKIASLSKGWLQPLPTRLPGGERVMCTACYLDNAADVEAQMRRASELLPGASIKVAAVGVTDGVRRVLGQYLIEGAAHIGATDLAPWTPEGRYRRTKEEHEFGRLRGKAYISHHSPVKKMDQLVDEERKSRGP